ncbi:MAG: hypothetical protein AAGA48_38265 [Myxococcota bacterium]
MWHYFAMAVAAPLDDAGQSALDELHKDVQRIRQVPFTRPRGRSMSVEELHQHEVDSLAEWMKPEDWRRASLALRVLDLAEPGFDLERSLIRLLGQGVQGFYDPDEHELVIVDRPGGLPWRQVAGHEMAHAQQMSRFEAWPTRVPRLGNDDVVAAFDGLLEGEAMLIEVALSGAEPMVADLQALIPGFWVHSPVFHQPDVPSAVLESVGYAYTFGAEFAQSLLKARGWAAFDDAFRRPPISTEQVLHPEKFRDRDWPQRVPLDVTEVLVDYELVEENTVGELGIVTMLRQWGYPRQAWIVASGWDGDRMQVLVRDEELVLVWRLVWDTPEDAERFVTQLRDRWTVEEGTRIERRDTQVVVLRGVQESHVAEVFREAWRRRTRTVRRIEALIDRQVLRRWRRDQQRQARDR